MAEHSQDSLEERLGSIVEDGRLRTIYAIGFSVLDALKPEQLIRDEKSGVELLPDGRLISFSHSPILDRNNFFVKVRKSAKGPGAAEFTNFVWRAGDPGNSNHQYVNGGVQGNYMRKTSQGFSSQDIEILEEVTSAVVKNRKSRGVL